MAESETIEGEVMPLQFFQARIVGETEWSNRIAKSIMEAATAESIAVTIKKRVSDIGPMVVQVRQQKGITLPHDVTTLDVICTVNFMVTARDPSERN